jgi:hypothetical protein
VAFENRQTRDDAPTEGSWAYISGPRDMSDPDLRRALYERLTDACLAYGLHVYRPDAEPVDAGNEASRRHHAVGHADVCVFYVGDASAAVARELAWAAEQRRPVIALCMQDERPSEAVNSMLMAHTRARMLLCDDPADCARKVSETLADPQWQTVVRAAEAELADELF